VSFTINESKPLDCSDADHHLRRAARENDCEAGS
jgi:hypothetical protein